MTAFVVDLRRERVTICADTGAYLDGVPPRLGGYVTKVHPLPHLGALVFGRGPLVVPAEVALRVNLAPAIDNLDDLVELMPDLLRRVVDAACEVYMVGWSGRSRRMRFWAWLGHADWRPLTADGSTAIIALPRPEPMPQRRAAVDAYLLAVMKAQRRMFQANPEGRALVGGAVQRWQVDRRGISQTVLHRFVDGPADADLAAA